MKIPRRHLFEMRHKSRREFLRQALGTVKLQTTTDLDVSHELLQWLLTFAADTTQIECHDMRRRAGARKCHKCGEIKLKNRLPRKKYCFTLIAFCDNETTSTLPQANSIKVLYLIYTNYYRRSECQKTKLFARRQFDVDRPKKRRKRSAQLIGFHSLQ